MADLGTLLTAIVTPFDEQLRIDEGAFVSLLAHLARNGSEMASSSPARPARPRR